MPKIFVKRTELTQNTSQKIALDNSFHSFVIKNFSQSTPILVSFQDDIESIKIPAMSYQVISMSENNATANAISVVAPDADGEIEVQGIVDTAVPAIGNLSSSSSQGGDLSDLSLESKAFEGISMAAGSSITLQDESTQLGNEVPLIGELILTDTQILQLTSTANRAATLTAEQIEVCKKYNTISISFSQNNHGSMSVFFRKTGANLTRNDDDTEISISNNSYIFFAGTLLWFSSLPALMHNDLIRVNLRDNECKWIPNTETTFFRYGIDQSNIPINWSSTPVFTSYIDVYDADADQHYNLPIFPQLPSSASTSSHKWQLLYNPGTNELEWVETDIPAVPAS